MSVETISCPSCQHGLKVGAELKGKRVRCPKCQNVMTVPGAAAPAAGAVWHVARGKQKIGPYSGAQLKKLAAAGELDAEDKVMRDGNAKWIVAGSVKGLFPQAEPGTLAPEPEPVEAARDADDGDEDDRDPKRKKKGTSKGKKAAPARKVPMALLLGGGGVLAFFLLAGLAVGGYFLFLRSATSDNTNGPSGPGTGRPNPPNTAPTIIGTWVVTSAVWEGKETPQSVGEKLTFKDDGTWTASRAGSTPETGTYKIDAAAKPMTLDLKSTSDPKTGSSICEITGDTMRVCIGKDIAKRPTELKPGPDVRLLTLNRQPPPGPDSPSTKLVGTWLVDSASVDGKESARVVGETFTFGDDGSFALSNKGSGPSTGTYQCDATAKPMTLAFTYSGQVAAGEFYIFDIAGDTLTLCISFERDIANRPKEFKPGPKVALMTLKRQAPPVGGTPKPPLKPGKLVGKWDTTGVVHDGTEGQTGGHTWTFRDDGTFDISSIGEAPMAGTYKHDANASPATLDLTFSNNPGKPSLYLIEIDGDEMKLCWSPPGGKRPTEIKGTGGAMIYKLKRLPAG